MGLRLIAAVAQDDVIGFQDGIPWRKTKEDRTRYREDMARFKTLTANHPVIMGRKTFNSIDKKYVPLDSGRTTIVISKTMNFEDNPGIVICRTLPEAVRKASQINENFYCAGGQTLYGALIGKLAERLEITEIHRRFEGDTFFPEINPKVWREAFREDHENYSFVTYERS